MIYSGLWLRARNFLLEIHRYSIAILLGLCIDLTIGFAVLRFLSTSLAVSAAAGFTVSVAFNYILFEKWVFRKGRLSISRLGQTYMAALGALIVRLATIALFGDMIRDGSLHMDLATLALAAGFSFVVNLVLLKRCF